MKKLFILAAAALMFTACSKDSEVVPSQEKNDNTAIGFQVLNKNMSRAALQDEGHLNFGVFAYKSTDATHNIMDDYLVGYMDGANKKGYKFAAETQTTLSSSYWAYEKLGTSEYTLDALGTGENYYLATLATDKRYMSNNANQYLRYWDKNAPTTNFYAYAPYVNKEFNHFATGVKYDNASHTMTFPAASIVAGFDERDKYEFLFAGKQVATGAYGDEVELAFKHMNARVKITFYEVIEGYKVTMKPLQEGTYDFISAVPSLETSHTYGEVFKTAGANIVFSEPKYEIGTVAINNTVNYDKYLEFNVPTASYIAEDRSNAVSKAENYSSSVYYAIPKHNTTGLTFHVSFLLTSTTGETILVKDATVYVPKDNCNWEANKSYTYVFKITKNTSGKTETDPSIDPNNPQPRTEDALYPIIFDNCTVEDWEAATESDHDIN